MIAGGGRWIGDVADFVTAPFAVVVTEADPLTLHAGPNYDTAVVALLPRGATVNVLAWDAGFDDTGACGGDGSMARVEGPSGAQGYACQAFLSATGNPPSAPSQGRVTAPVVAFDAPTGPSARSLVLVAGALAFAAVGAAVLVHRWRA